MTDQQHASGPSVPDLLMQLLRQQSEGFGEVRLSLADQYKTINRIDLELALLKRDYEQMAGVPARVHGLEASRDLHARLIADAQTCDKDHNTRIGNLETTSSQRTGVENVSGKFWYVLGGAVVTAIVVAIALALRT